MTRRRGRSDHFGETHSGQSTVKRAPNRDWASASSDVSPPAVVTNDDSRREGTQDRKVWSIRPWLVVWIGFLDWKNIPKNTSVPRNLQHWNWSKIQIHILQCLDVKQNKKWLFCYRCCLERAFPLKFYIIFHSKCNVKENRGPKIFFGMDMELDYRG